MTTRVLLFDARGEDRVVPVDEVSLCALSAHELAWLDVTSTNESDFADALRSLDLEELPIASLNGHSAWFSQKDWFGLRAHAPAPESAEGDDGLPWLLLVGPNIVATFHREPIAFLEAIAENGDPASRTGQLRAESFAAAMLDRMLTAWLDEIDEFEDRIDHLEVEIMQPRVRDSHLPRLRQLRRDASSMRRILSSDRDLFDALARPDFMPEQEETVSAHFRAVAKRYDRVMHAMENARDLAVGSHELLSTRLAQRTNDTMRVLTFATVLIGSLAVVAGVLGMNFAASVFDSADRGFWITVSAMILLVALAVLLARIRGWWK